MTSRLLSLLANSMIFNLMSEKVSKDKVLKVRDELESVRTVESSDLKISFLHKVFKTCKNAHTTPINDKNDKNKSYASKCDTKVQIRATKMLKRLHSCLKIGNM